MEIEYMSVNKLQSDASDCHMGNILNFLIRLLKLTRVETQVSITFKESNAHKAIKAVLHVTCRLFLLPIYLVLSMLRYILRSNFSDHGSVKTEYPLLRRSLHHIQGASLLVPSWTIRW